MNTKLKVSDQFGTISVDLNRKLDPQESALLIQFATALVAGNTILPLGIVTNSTIPQEYRINFNGTASNKIQAIKLVREFTGMGLKEAKDIVEGTIKCPALSHEKVTALSKELIRYGINEFIVQSMPMVPLAG